MSKRLWVLPIVVGLLIACGGLAQAIPSLGGPTGIVVTPTAEIATQNLADVVVSGQAFKPNSDSLTNWQISALGSIASTAELWVAYSTIKDDFDSHMWSAGAKAQVYKTPNPCATPTAIAIGGGWFGWNDGLLTWAEGLPRSGQNKWSNSLPESIRDDVRRLLGLEPPIIPGHTLEVTATATPNEINQDADQSIDLLADAVDSLGVPDTFQWSVSPTNVGHFTSATDQQAATFLVTSSLMYGDPDRIITFTVEATSSADGLQASADAQVTQMYLTPAAGGAVLSPSAALASAPVVTKDAAVNMASVRRTLADVSAPVGRDINPNDPTAILLANEGLSAWNAYLVATTDLSGVAGSEWCKGWRILGSLGVLYEKVSPDLGDDLTLTQPFVSVKFAGKEGAALGLEYRWKDSDLDAKAVFSAVLSYAFPNSIVAEVGTTNASPIGLGLDNQDWFARVGYSFALGAW